VSKRSYSQDQKSESKQQTDRARHSKISLIIDQAESEKFSEIEDEVEVKIPQTKFESSKQ